jgi:hypothetical protein
VNKPSQLYRQNTENEWGKQPTIHTNKSGREITMKTLKSKSVWGLALVLALASLMVAVPAGAAPLAAGGNAIVVHAQDITTGQVLVSSVTAAQDGWLLIWNDRNGAPDSLLGYAAVHQGVNTGMAVDVRTANRNGLDNITATLWATVMPDSNADTPFASPDPSIMPAESVLAVAFASSADAGMAPAMASAATLPTTGGVSSAPLSNKISIRRQDANSGAVIVDSVTAAQDGWLLIFRDANGAPDELLGYAAVHQGVNTGIVVDIKTTNRGGNDFLTPTLWASLVADPNAMTPYAAPDRAITGNSQLMVGFGSTAS